MCVCASRVFVEACWARLASIEATKQQATTERPPFFSFFFVRLIFQHGQSPIVWGTCRARSSLPFARESTVSFCAVDEVETIQVSLSSSFIFSRWVRVLAIFSIALENKAASIFTASACYISFIYPFFNPGRDPNTCDTREGGGIDLVKKRRREKKRRRRIALAI